MCNDQSSLNMQIKCKCKKKKKFLAQPAHLLVYPEGEVPDRRCGRSHHIHHIKAFGPQHPLVHSWGRCIWQAVCDKWIFQINLYKIYKIKSFIALSIHMVSCFKYNSRLGQFHCHSFLFAHKLLKLSSYQVKQ